MAWFLCVFFLKLLCVMFQLLSGRRNTLLLNPATQKTWCWMQVTEICPLFLFFKQAVRTVLSWCLTSLGWLSKTERPEDNGSRDGHSLGNDVQRQSISLDPFLHWFPAITASYANWIFTSHFIFNQHGMQHTTGTEQQNCFYSRTNHLVIQFQHAEWNGGKPRITRKTEKLKPISGKNCIHYTLITSILTCTT